MMLFIADPPRTTSTFTGQDRVVRGFQGRPCFNTWLSALYIGVVHLRIMGIGLVDAIS